MAENLNGVHKLLCYLPVANLAIGRLKGGAMERTVEDRLSKIRDKKIRMIQGVFGNAVAEVVTNLTRHELEFVFGPMTLDMARRYRYHPPITLTLASANSHQVIFPLEPQDSLQDPDNYVSFDVRDDADIRFQCQSNVYFQTSSHILHVPL